MTTYKAVMRPVLEYASSICSPLAYSTSINKLHVIQNTALRTATGCIQDTHIQHPHDKTRTLPIHEHLQFHASQFKQKTQHPTHPLHKHTTYFNTPRLKNTFQQFPLHTSIISSYLATRGNNKILRTPPPHISSSEEILPASLDAPLPNYICFRELKYLATFQHAVMKSRKCNLTSVQLVQFPPEVVRCNA